jgi:hypothetical protein
MHKALAAALAASVAVALAAPAEETAFRGYYGVAETGSDAEAGTASGVLAFSDVESGESWALLGPYDTSAAAEAALAGEPHARFAAALFATPGAELEAPTADVSEAFYAVRSVTLTDGGDAFVRSLTDAAFFPAYTGAGLEVIELHPIGADVDVIAFFGRFDTQDEARAFAEGGSYTAVVEAASTLAVYAGCEAVGDGLLNALGRMVVSEETGVASRAVAASVVAE